MQDAYRVEVLADPQITAARRSWSECMAAEGFPTDSVSQLANSMPPPEDQQARASMTDQEKMSFDAELLAQEIPAAETVVRCDEQELFPVLPELAELEQSWMDEHAQELRQLRETDRILWGAYVDLLQPELQHATRVTADHLVRSTVTDQQGPLRDAASLCVRAFDLRPTP